MRLRPLIDGSPVLKGLGGASSFINQGSTLLFKGVLSRLSRLSIGYTGIHLTEVLCGVHT